MGIYIFTWERLKDALVRDSKVHPDSDFGMHIIPLMISEGRTMFAYRFNDYWKDVGTIESYWAANMELIETLPEFNLYEDFWKIYTFSDHQPPQYLGPDSDVRTAILSDGCEILGCVNHSVLGPEVFIDEGARVNDSIIMAGCRIGKNAVIDRCIIDEGCVVGDNVTIGDGDNTPNVLKPKIYDVGITVVGAGSVIPGGVSIGKNCVICGNTDESSYKDNRLESGETLVKS